MIRIALIGDIASGKTLISKYFNFPIFNADAEVKNIYKRNKQCFKKLNKKFPKHIFSFPISKSEIKKIISKKNIKIISKIVHPYVRQNLRKFLEKNKKNPYVILDIPLLLENKLNKKNDILIFVKISKRNVLKRLKKRGIYDKKIFDILKSQQLNLKKKASYAQYFIDNNKNKKYTIKQVKIILNKLNDRSSS